MVNVCLLDDDGVPSVDAAGGSGNDGMERRILQTPLIRWNGCCIVNILIQELR